MFEEKKKKKKKNADTAVIIQPKGDLFELNYALKLYQAENW